METTYEYSLYGGCDDQVNGPSDFDYHYWNAPQIPLFGSDIIDFVQPNLWHESVTYDAPPVTTHGGSYLSDFQEYDNVYNTAYYLQPNYIPLIPAQYHLYCSYQPVYYVYTPVYQGYYVPSHFYVPTPTYNASVSSYVDTSPSFENEVLPPFVGQNVDAYEEFNSSSQNFGNGVPDNMYGSMEELVGEEITSCHLSYAEYPEIMNDAGVENEEERKKQFKELQWRPHQLNSIREEKEQGSTEMKVDKTLRRGILKNPKKDLGSQPRKRGHPYRVRFKEEAEREKNKDSGSGTMRGPYRVRLEEGAVKKKVIFEKDVIYKKDVDSESRKMSDPRRVRVEEGGAISRKDLCSESPKSGDPCTVRIGDVEVRYAPDRYRVFCLENRHRKRFPSIRKFLARMFGKNPP